MDISNKILGAIAIVVIVITLLALTPVVVDTVEASITQSEAQVVVDEFAFNGTGGKVYSGRVEFHNIDNASGFSIGNTTLEVTDNGAGVLNGGDGVGTINYITGAWSITWDADIEIGDEFVANYESLGWTFLGAEGAAALLSLVPFVWIAAILICAVVGMITLSKGS